MKLLFVGTPADKAYLPRLKPCIGVAACAVILETPTTFSELKAIMKAKGADHVISTSSTLLEKLVSAQSGQIKTKKPSIDNYAGSLFHVPGSPEIEIVFINPLEQLISVTYGQFITSRYISKLTAKDSWYQAPKFSWKLFEESQAQEIIQEFSTASAIAIDIETFKEPPSIRCVGYTALFFSASGETSTKSLVIPCDSLFNLSVIRTLNNLEIPKVFQNGKYDLSYLQAYNAAPHSYFWDTAEMFHSWYSELPKDLASLNSFFVRDSMYWKDLANTSDLHQYYLYNAKDTWATLVVFLAWIQEAPQWAKDNYLNTFPLQFPCHLSEMTGIARDTDKMKENKQKQEVIISEKSTSLDKMLGVKGFNVSSPLQVKALLKILGCADLESADEKNLKKARLRHPLNERIISSVVSVRKARKLVSTYLTEGKEFYGHLGQYKRVDSTKRGRVLYSLNPHGTDTGRLASKEHHFWCGLQIQNIPGGASVKSSFIADDGFQLCECDLEQAESRDTAYIAGEENLITAVSSTKDFHSVNASAFFGVPYDTIYDDSIGKTKDKPLRDLAKRVNHGANYNMGAGVLIETMGEDKIWEAKRLLKLPRLYTSKQVAEYLLAQFHKTYPAISKIYYPGVIHEILTTSRLSSKATHDVPSYCQASTNGLVRHCFGKPDKSKSALNAYVAHPPQSLNAMTLNRAYMRIFYEIALNPKFSSHFKLCAQIHDSVLFQFRKGHEYLIPKVKEAMEIPVTVKGYDGKIRTFIVPAAAKAGKEGKGATYWSETE